MDFERKFEFFQNHKKSYMRPLCMTDPQYGCHDREIWSFVQFLPKTDEFW
jgi:hypothetical protein